MKVFHVHYKNKYPSAQITVTDKSLDVHENGKHLVSIGMDAAGNFKDYSKERGCEDAHDLCPIPKRTRIFKGCPVSGDVVRDELHESRLEKQDANNWEEDRGFKRARSIAELKKMEMTGQLVSEESVSSKKVSKAKAKK